MAAIPFSWTSSDVAIGETPYGRGIVALRNIRRGTRVIAFGGYMMTLETFSTLPKHIQEHPFQVADDLVFGQIAEHELSIADYLNHSCEPNCGFEGQAFVLAMRDVMAGEEITIDYAMCTSSPVLRDIKCLCESKSCRRIIKHDDWEILELQKKYKEYFQPYILEKIKNLCKMQNK